MTWPSETGEELWRISQILSPTGTSPVEKDTRVPCTINGRASGAGLDFAWQKDGMTSDEKDTLTSLQSLYCHHPSVFEVLMGYQWLSHDIDRDKLFTIYNIRHIAEVDLALAHHLVGLPWLADGPNFGERAAVETIDGLANRNSRGDIRARSLAWQIVLLPWFVDGITGGELHLLDFVKNMKMGNTQPGLIRRMMESEWFISGNAGESAEIITALYSIGSLYHLEMLVGQPWFLDGLTDSEVAVILALPHGSDVPDQEFQQALLQHEQVVSETVSLLLAGEIRLSAAGEVSFSPNSAVLPSVHTGVQTLETYMGEPWPGDRVVVFLDPPETPLPFGRGEKYNTHVILYMGEGHPGFRAVLYHELAHYYFGGNFGPIWLVEGAASFLAMYTLHTTENVRLESRYRSGSCPVGA